MGDRRIERAPVRNPSRRYGAIRLEPGEDEITRAAAEKTPQVRGRFIPVTYEYWAPFNYPNVYVELGRPPEANVIGHEYNWDGVELDFPPYGAITVEEEHPIVAVTVIGSACEAPGYVILHAEPLEWKYPRTAVKMKVDNLWGEHVRGWAWQAGVDESWHHAGLSSAHFELPDSKKVTIMGGSAPDLTGALLGGGGHATDHWNREYSAPDGHYCVRLIRVTVKEPFPN